MTDGATTFGRFAFPPNALGYCGPSDVELFRDVVEAGPSAAPELRHAITAFAGAWPYLSLIGGVHDRDPLDPDVVEAYWIGNGLLGSIDTLTWGNSLDDRFRTRSGGDWAAIKTAINAGGVPTHAFHVYCVYPWIGLLRSGMVDQALSVLEQCRIRWGIVRSAGGEHAVVESRPLVWDDDVLRLGVHRVETVEQSVDVQAHAAPGDLVAMHWNYICQPITVQQREQLEAHHRLHIGIVNADTRRLALTMER